MKKRIIRGGLLALAAAVVFMILLTVFTRPTTTDEFRYKKEADLPFVLSNWTYVDPGAVVLSLDEIMEENKQLTVEEGAILLSKRQIMSASFDLPEGGEYEIGVLYRPVKESVLENLFTVSAEGGEPVNVMLNSIWKDVQTKYITDRFGNETSPKQENVLDFVSDTFRIYDDINKNPVTYKFAGGGSVTFEIENTSQDILISEIYAVKKQDPPGYDEYIAESTQKYGNSQGTDFVTIEGEDYSIKSDSFIRGKGYKNVALTPYDTFRSLINAVNEASWNTPGQKIIWEFDIETPGFYQIGLHYTSDATMGMNTFRDIEINGRPLFSEMNAVMFPHTGTERYRNIVLEAYQDEPMRVYLEKGSHTLAMTVTSGEGSEVFDQIRNLMTDINGLGMDLKKLSAGGGDQNRTWDMDVYLPQAIPSLYNFADQIDEIYEKLRVINRDEPVFANNLKYAANTLRKMAEDSRTLPNKVTMLNEGDTSVSSVLGDVLPKINTQPLGIDSIYIFGDESLLPKEGASPLRSLGESLVALANSFGGYTPTPNFPGDPDEEDVLDVWIGRTTQYTEVLTVMAELDFAAETGIPVRVSRMQDPQRLVLANASRSNPDVVVGIPYATPYTFAVRGAVMDLLSYDYGDESFLDFYNEHYNLEGLAPVIYDGGVYGAVETQNFRVMYYRKDILEALNLSVPETWDDVYAILPQLLRYSMNFNVPLTNSVGYKALDSTSPFFFQYGGELYKPDGLSSAINYENSIKGFNALTEIFQIYGARQAVPSFFNSFRYGDIPIGISDVETYIQLKLAAPELSGKWEIALPPGVKNEDGTITRYYPASTTACMIFKNTEKPEESYRFLRWWLDTDTQAEYAHQLRGTFGPAYVWNTANLDSFAQLYFPEEHLDIIMEQLSWQKEPTAHPAGYMVERAISNAWTKVVTKDENKLVSIDYAALESDREIIRKLQEFNYIDSDGVVIREYPTDTVEELKRKVGAAK